MPPATTSGQAQQNLQGYANSMLSPQQAMDKANSQYGVSAAQQQVQGLRGAIQSTTNLLNNVAPSVMGRTANSLVTSAQANRQISNEQAPISAQLNQENQQYQGANQDYQSSLAQAQNAANATLTGQQNKLSYLQNIYNDLYTKEQNAAQLQAQRDAMAQQAAAARAASAAASPSFGNLAAALGGQGGGSQGGGGAAGSMSRNKAGGYAFTDASGRPITMGQYLASTGLSGNQIIQKAAQLLSQSNGGDKGIANAISSGHYSPAQLERLFPQVFGGNY